MQLDREYLTTGQTAQLTGVTIRTLRYYDQIHLLKPFKNAQTQKRLYSYSDILALQKIQTLKFIGLSLDEIKEIMSNEALAEQGLGYFLILQKNALIKKTVNTQYAIKAIHEAISLLRNQGQIDWQQLGQLIRSISIENDWLEQYQTANRLQKRIDFYDRFSNNPEGWHRWFFHQLGEKPNLKVLELGSGDGSLWKRNIDRIPSTWKITITDLSVGMVEEAKENLKDAGYQFRFLPADIQDIPFHDQEFDVVIANHMLYHVPDIEMALSEIRRVMKPDAEFYTSTLSKQHLKEMSRIVADFDSNIEVLDPIIDRFHLENGFDILTRWFTDVRFSRFEDHIQVNEIQPLIDYITSTPMNAKEMLVGTKMTRFTEYLKGKLNREKVLYMTKDLGYFRSKI